MRKEKHVFQGKIKFPPSSLLSHTPNSTLDLSLAPSCPGAPDGRSAVTLLMLAVPLSAWCPSASAESRAEMAGVDRVPPEGILSLPNAAPPQLLAALLNQCRHDKVKSKSSCVCKEHNDVKGKRVV